jgi:hypothetical protein
MCGSAALEAEAKIADGEDVREETQGGRSQDVSDLFQCSQRQPDSGTETTETWTRS